MDLTLTPEQEALEKALDAVLARGEDLGALGYLDVVRDAGPIEGVLVVERAAAAVAAGPTAARVLAGPLAGVHDLPAAVGLVEGRSALCRWGPVCDAYLVLDGDDALLAAREDVDVEPVESTYGAPYARITVRRGTRVAAGDRLRRAWQVAIAAEAEGLMLAAITKTAQHVSERVQFGRPIGAFQAVQHRLAAAYAQAMGARWLARRGAWYADDEFLTASAAAYACEAAALTYQNTHQVTGAIGITSEYGLVGLTLPLLALRQELGGQRAHARRVALARRAMDKPWPSPIPLPS
ncbi:MAG TPA: acyl-CoA dehydrogenase family protein [Acidimicrobiales bacterium]|nr:acyl-CoA dehydrogenase family protein [Acidimicrobiales bacterium]